jgi:K+-sensing histidine kinase KdpD
MTPLILKRPQNFAEIRPTASIRIKMAMASIVSLFIMAYIDYLTGYELIFSAAYLIPVSISAWYFGRPAIWLMSMACGLTSWLVDRFSAHAYAHFMIQYWNGFMCFVICLITGLLLRRLRQTLDERARMNIDLQQALEKLYQSTEEIRQLQNGLQVVCAWTKRIKVGEQWMTPEEFLSNQLHLKLTHGISPEAARQFVQEMEPKTGVKAGPRRQTL